MIPALCPCCRKPMKHYKAPRIGEYKSCLEHGTLTSLDFFKGHATRHTVAQQIIEARKNSKAIDQNRKLPCPVCRNQTMHTTHFPAQPNSFDIDQCFKCNSIWFDADEMKKLFFGSHVKQNAISELKLPINYTFADGSIAPDIMDPFYFLGFPVKGIESQTNHRQLMAYLLLFVVILLSWKGFRSVEYFENWMLIPEEFKRHNGLTMITSIFLHAGWWHLISNMYFLFICAENIEEKKGSLFVLELFLLSALVGNIAYVLSPATLPTIGASGGVSGLLVYFAFQFPHARFYSRAGSLFFLNILTKVESVGFFLFVWFITQLVGLLMDHQSVNYWAHLGGAATGFLFYLVSNISESKK